MGRQRRSRSITDICGGRRAAIVPARDARDPQVPDGAFRLYVDMCGAAKPDGKRQMCLKSYARAIKKDVRTVQRHKSDLEEIGWIEQTSVGDKAIASFRVIRDPRERPKAQAANFPKIQERKRRKTPPATNASQTRCDTDVAQYMSHKHDPLLSPNGEAAPLQTQSKKLRDKQPRNSSFNPGGSDSADDYAAGSQARDQRWGYWVEWLQDTYGIENGWLWVAEKGEEIKIKAGVNTKDADKILEACLFRARSINANYSQLPNLIEEAIRQGSASTPRKA